MSNALTKLEPQGALEVDRPQRVDMQALMVAAMEKGPEIVERMMAVRRELNTEQAKTAFDLALAHFQAECPPITKSKTVLNESATKLYSYAPFERILEVVRPYLEKHGLSFTLDTDLESKDGWVIATCKIKHIAGHSEVSRAKFPLGAGTRAMSTTQVYAAALSFASRRVFCNALGIVTAGEDMDGRGGLPPQKSPMKKTGDDATREKKAALWALLVGVRGQDKSWSTAEAWLRSHKIIGDAETISGMTAEQLVFVIEKTEIQLNEK